MKNKNYIYIHTLGLNSFGGREFLKYILHQNKKKKILVFLDSRINANEFGIKEYIQFQNNILMRIYTFLKRIYWKLFTRKKFEEIFVNGIPPLIKLNNKSNITILFQNVFLIDNSFDKYLSNTNKIKFTLLRIYIKTFLKKSYIVFLQSEAMKNHFKKLNLRVNKAKVDKSIWINYFSEKHSNKTNKIKLEQKYDSFRKIEKIVNSKKLIYFYPASFEKHKNHYRLIRAFNNLPQTIKQKIFLVLTVSKINLGRINLDKNIIALGNIDRNYINYLLKNANFLIFPSIVESLGIPLLEAKFSNLKLLASNISIVKEISQPLITFDPEDTNDIQNAISLSIKT